MTDTSSYKAKKVPKATRLMNLVFFLEGRPEGATARQVKDCVAGYGEGQSAEAFKRQFRRDRLDLRRMGFPIEQSGEGNDLRYLLDLSKTRQQPLNLDVRELALLEICAANALESPGFPLRADLAQACAKLPSSMGQLTTKRLSGTTSIPADKSPSEGGRTDLASVDANASSDAEILSAVEEARERDMALGFDYTTALGSSSERTAIPLDVFVHLGDLYLFAFDTDRRDTRRFRFDRFASMPRLLPIEASDLAEALLHTDDERVLMPFQIGPGCHEGKVFISARATDRAESLTRGLGTLEPCGDGFVWRIGVADPEAFLRWSIENGPGLLVLAPQEATDAAARLESLIGRLERRWEEAGDA